jgi:hypothetical protein
MPSTVESMLDACEKLVKEYGSQRVPYEKSIGMSHQFMLNLMERIVALETLVLKMQEVVDDLAIMPLLKERMKDLEQ